jgi:hypothetical protein
MTSELAHFHFRKRRLVCQTRMMAVGAAEYGGDELENIGPLDPRCLHLADEWNIIDDGTLVLCHSATPQMCSTIRVPAGKF